MLVLETVFDLKYMILPDYATSIMALMIIIIGIISGQDLISSLGGGAIGAGVIGGIYLATRGRGMGLGDVKLMPVLGWWLGWKLTIVALYLAFIGGAIVGLVLLGTGKVKRKQPIPFGPFLMIGAYMSWWGATGWLALIKSWF
jgi:prepilin signal peptidase PulO-like enzyme (type II secretory pathway)